MPFSSLVAFALSLPNALWVFLTRPHPPLPDVTPPLKEQAVSVATLEQLILSCRKSFHSIVTGGTLSPVMPSIAAIEAPLIIRYAAISKVKVSDVAALLDGESAFDPGATNPNRQDAKPGETPTQALQHEDVGLAQEDVSTAEGDHAYRGMVPSEIVTKLEEPEVAIAFACTTLAGNFVWAAQHFALDPTLASKVPNGDSRVLGFEAYNSGRGGSLRMSRAKGLAGNWSYGTSAVERAAKFATMLGEA